MRKFIQPVASLAGVAAVTIAVSQLVPVNFTTAGFAYLLLVLIVASTWGFTDALIASIASTLAFNYYFFPPVRTLTIADPQNWIALFSFLATSVIASRLSTEARRRTQEAIDSRQDVERLYTFSRAILLIGESESFPRELLQKLTDIFQANAAVLFEKSTGVIHRAGPLEFEGLDSQLRETALTGAAFFDAERQRVVTAIRLGSEPIAALALQGATMPDSVLQGVANLVAIGLERAKSQYLTHQVEAALRTEQIRIALIDAMAHELKTPLTSIKAVTTSLLSDPNQPLESRTELLTVADEEADRLRRFIDDSVEMARIDNARIDLHVGIFDIRDVVEEVLASMRSEIEDTKMEVSYEKNLPSIALDPRLVKLALKQLVDNALKYAAPSVPVKILVHSGDGTILIEITNFGEGIPVVEQSRIFDRFYRSPSVRHRIPGTGLGLSIAQSIAQAHKGDVTVMSRNGETTFRMTLPTLTGEKAK